jgi:SagB-type dehydrogenase family enzyme
MREYRKYLKNDVLPSIGNVETDQKKGIPAPPLQQPYPKDAKLIDLVAPQDLTLGQISLIRAINNRRSRRKYTTESLTIEELSFLLWITQGVKEISKTKVYALRTVPSGGARHPFETYLVVNRVQGLEPGIYRYLALEHKLCFLSPAEPDFPQRVSKACCNQTFIGTAAVIFIWSVVPYRSEWRYADDNIKDIGISAGHICQNLYLGCEAIGAGTCAVLAFYQKEVDSIIGVDGEDEFAFYVAPVGKIDSVDTKNS